ncbi:hypothetical protein [Maridesulfovibrio sp.]|uniref:hypothetical protein n=1 Tax=Maridesulfovibrio sp. TaxID=2795000 RepID=UPI003AFFE449
MLGALYGSINRLPRCWGIMMLKFYRLVLGILLVCIAACASHPLGFSDDEWAELTPQQKLEAKEKQAVLDLKARELALEREKRYQEEKRLERQRERQADIANGLIAEFSPDRYACFGGEKCRNRRDGDVNELIIPLHGLSNVDYLQIYADDRVGNKHEGLMSVNADRFKVQTLDLSKKTKSYQVFIGRTARNIVLRAETDDEIRVFRVKVFGSRIDNSRIDYTVIK